MRPDYGTSIRTQLFELTDSKTRLNLISSIRNIINKYEKRVSVGNIDVQEDDNNILRIKIYGSYVIENNSDEGSSLLLELGINVGNAEANDV
jgi:phage baseplate assembly protein W